MSVIKAAAVLLFWGAAYTVVCIARLLVKGLWELGSMPFVELVLFSIGMTLVVLYLAQRFL